MTNPLRGEASFDADGQTYTLTIDVNALCSAEDVLGMDIDAALVQYESRASTSLTRGLIWAALQKKHPCSIDDAGDIMSGAGFVVAKAALEKAIKNAMPEAAADENPPGRGLDGTGGSS